MAEHTDETTIANLRELLRIVAAERDELQKLVASFRPGIVYIEELKAIARCRQYNRKKSEATT